MASLCRSASRLASRSILTTPSKILSPSPPLASAIIPRASRILCAVGCVESMMPLHSAIANARLTSSLALDSTCWSFLSRGLQKTL